MAEKIRITIFQAPLASLEEHGLMRKMYADHQFIEPIPAQFYMPVFSGMIDVPAVLPKDTEMRRGIILEHIFFLFNIRHPAGYCGRSLSVGDVVLLEEQHYLCSTFGYTPVVFTSVEHSINKLTLPDGHALEAEVYAGGEYPCINIERISKDGTREKVCFVEHNPEKPEGQRLCIGVYCSEEDDTVYYGSYDGNTEKKTGQ